MDLENRVKILEQEVQILKNQIQVTLMEIQEHILNQQYTSLRPNSPGAASRAPALHGLTQSTAASPSQRAPSDEAGMLPEAPARSSSVRSFEAGREQYELPYEDEYDPAPPAQPTSEPAVFPPSEPNISTENETGQPRSSVRIDPPPDMFDMEESTGTNEEPIPYREPSLEDMPPSSATLYERFSETQTEETRFAGENGVPGQEAIGHQIAGGDVYVDNQSGSTGANDIETEWESFTRYSEWALSNIRNLGAERARMLVGFYADSGVYTRSVELALLILIQRFEQHGSVDQWIENTVDAFIGETESPSLEQMDGSEPSYDDPEPAGPDDTARQKQGSKRDVILRMIEGLKAMDAEWSGKHG